MQLLLNPRSGSSCYLAKGKDSGRGQELNAFGPAENEQGRRSRYTISLPVEMVFRKGLYPSLGGRGR